MAHEFDDSEMESLLQKEEEKLAMLRELVDSACEEIMGGRLDRQEATVLAQRVRRQAQEIIPDLMDQIADETVAIEPIQVGAALSLLRTLALSGISP